MLSETGQENVVSVNICRYSSCIVLKDIEKKRFSSEISYSVCLIIMILHRMEKGSRKMMIILNKQTRLYEATAGRVQFDKIHFSVGNG